MPVVMINAMEQLARQTEGDYSAVSGQSGPVVKASCWGKNIGLQAVSAGSKAGRITVV